MLFRHVGMGIGMYNIILTDFMADTYIIMCSIIIYVLLGRRVM